MTTLEIKQSNDFGEDWQHLDLSQDIEAVCNSLGIQQCKNDITAVYVLAIDGDIIGCYMTDSNTHHDVNTWYYPWTYYMDDNNYNPKTQPVTRFQLVRTNETYIYIWRRGRVTDKCNLYFVDTETRRNRVNEILAYRAEYDFINLGDEYTTTYYNVLEA